MEVRCPAHLPLQQPLLVKVLLSVNHLLLKDSLSVLKNTLNLLAKGCCCLVQMDLLCCVQEQGPDCSSGSGDLAHLGDGALS